LKTRFHDEQTRNYLLPNSNPNQLAKVSDTPTNKKDWTILRSSFTWIQTWTVKHFVTVDTRWPALRETTQQKHMMKISNQL